MRRSACAIASFAALALARPAGATEKVRIAVFALDSDVARATAMRSAIQASLLSLPDVAVVSDESLATLNRVAPVPEPPRAESETDLLLVARRAAAEDRLADAVEALALLEERQEKQPTLVIEERVKMRLWRATVLLSMGLRERAETEVRTALTLQPLLHPDKTVFRPSLIALVDEVRPTLSDVTLTVQQLPPGATLTIDGVTQTASRVKLPTGRHWIRITQPGFRTLERSFDAVADGPLPAAIPLELDHTIHVTLLAGLFGSVADRQTPAGKISAQDAAAFDQIASSIGADALIVATGAEPPQEATAVIWRANDDPLHVPTFASPAQNADWLCAALSKGLPHTPRGSTVAPARAAPEHGTPTFLSAAAIFAQRNESVISTGGESARFRGAGLELAASRPFQEWLGELAIQGESYAMLPAKVGNARLSGGVRLDVRLSAARHFWLGSASAPRLLSVDAGGGLRFEQLDAHDAAHLFAARQILAPELRADARLPVLLFGEPVFFAGGVSARPVAIFRESPSGATGSSPAFEPSLEWRASAGWARGPWRVSAGWLDSHMRVAFHGAGSALVSPSLASARIDEQRRALTLTASRSF